MKIEKCELCGVTPVKAENDFVDILWHLNDKCELNPITCFSVERWNALQRAIRLKIKEKNNV